MFYTLRIQTETLETTNPPSRSPYEQIRLLVNQFVVVCIHELIRIGSDREQVYQTWHLFDANSVSKYLGLGELGSHVQLRIHPDNPFPYVHQVTTRLTLPISTVPLGVVTLKTLLALRGTRVSNGAGIRLAYTAKRTCTVGVFRDPCIRKNSFPFPTSPAINDTLCAYRPTSGTSSFYLVEIR